MPEELSNGVTSEELLRWPLFAGESPEAIEWLASNMSVRRYESGDVFAREGDVVHELLIVLEGELHFSRSGFNDLFIFRAGQPTGLLPFSRMKNWIGRGWAVQTVRVGCLEGSLLRELVNRAPVLAQTLVSMMTDRTREFTRMQEGSNRLLALGKLAAGLAHELNNPASAAVRSSSRLRQVLAERRQHVLELRSIVIPEAAAAILSALGDRIAECTAAIPGSYDALERSDQESDLADWLESKNAPTELATHLVEARLAIQDLEPLSRLIDSKFLSLGLRVLIADHEIICLANELEEASRRVSELVQAVKSYSYMDRSPIADVDIEQSIDLTLRMFQHQIKHGIEVSRQYASNLPLIRANGGELNQIWTNLIDNAIDAMATSANPKVLTIRTVAEPKCILVEITDSGPGIPQEVQGRIFEPFFTTKAVGDGTGLGLDIVLRIVRQHKGSIRVESVTGRTTFQVRLPLES